MSLIQLRTLRSTLLATVLGLSVAACGGGGGGSSASAIGGAPPPPPPTTPLPTAPGSVLISWTPPTQNTDGTALTDLAGYEIRYGRSASSLDQWVSIDTVGMADYTVPNLASGTWYFSVSARNQGGILSPPSEVVSKNVG